MAFAAPASTDLKTALGHIAEQARPGTMGIAVMNVADGRVVKVSGNRSYLMMSAFKAPIAAAVLARVDSGELKLDQRVRLVPGDVVPGSAVPSLGDQLKAGALDVSVEALLRAAVTQSDNTAADALLRLLGGGAVATHFLQSKGIAGMRIDMGERELGQRLNGFRSTEPSPARESALAAEQREKRGFEAVLASKVNTTTLDGAVAFLDKLQSGRLLSTSSTRMLLGMMTAQIIPNRLRSGLPAGFQLADKTGTDVTYQDRLGAWNDMGIITTPDGRRVIVAIFLSDSLATPKQADAWFAEIGRLVAASMH
ncbi:class A beta-lactamase [Dyella sp.]|uniref:class A beta-lactamase n=1 Tax=Dyella sp. TaxID=1869338 RepID=UPI002ED11339